MANSDPLISKKSFLQENQNLTEVELHGESKPIGKLDEFDLVQNEIWMLQCPKGMDVTELQNQTLKIPGRTIINSTEAVSIEFNEGKEQHAFAYYNRNGDYDLRLLPVKGTIVVRDRLKVADSVTTELGKTYSNCAKREAMPSITRVRHPLLGVQYEDKVELDKCITERLRKADEVSAKILKESIDRKNEPILKSDSSKSTLGKQKNLNSPIEINSADEVEFEERIKKTKSKRKYSDINVEENNNKQIKKSLIKEEFVSEDLQWIKNI